MVAQNKFLEVSSVTVKSIACNAIKIHLESGRVAKFIVQMKRANRPHILAGIKGAEDCSQWGFPQ